MMTDPWSVDLMTSGSFRWPCKINKNYLSCEARTDRADWEKMVWKQFVVIRAQKFTYW